MAVATVPTLGGTTLPVPKRQSYERLFRGGHSEMADGSIVIDLVDTTARHKFSLRWEYVDETELGTITTAWDAIKNTTATYVSIRNTSHTVTQPDGATLKVEIINVAGGVLNYNVDMELIEDS